MQCLAGHLGPGFAQDTAAQHITGGIFQWSATSLDFPPGIQRGIHFNLTAKFL